jgi:two-component system chemotaxis response regulator CheY
MKQPLNPSELQRALVVDDMASMRMLIRAVLHQMGIMHVAEANKGQDALKYLEHNTVDIVICDWNMPGMTGLDVLTNIRQQPDLKGLPVLLVTAEQSQAQVREAIQAGVTSYVTKPFKPATLQAHVRHCLARRVR